MTRATVIQTMEVLLDADLAAADTARCVELLSGVRRARGWLDEFEARVSTQMRCLATTPATPGGGAGVSDAHGSAGRTSAAQGRRKDRRSKILDEAPSFGDALAAGSISAEHVDALANATAGVDDAVKSVLLDQHDALVAAAASKTPEQFARRCRDRIRRIERDHGISRNHQQRTQTYLSRFLDPATGMTKGHLAFHPELANQVFGAIDSEVAAMIAAGERSGEPEFVNRTYDRNRLAAEALGRLVAGGHDRARPLEPDVSMVIDHRTALTGELHDRSICETSDGAPVPPETIRRLLCDCRLTPLTVDDDGVVLRAGRTIRTANRHQRRALRAMYRTCAIDGCDAAFDQCHIHHVQWYEHSGATDISNLLPLCARHHHLVHEGGWTLHLAPDRTLTVTRSDDAPPVSCRADMVGERDDPPEPRRRLPAA